MSLDGGGMSNSPGAQETASAMEEDYCLHGPERFRQQWATTGVFHAGALRLYGITGEPQLLRSIRQTRMLSATFGTCFLGRFDLPLLSPQRMSQEISSLTRQAAVKRKSSEDDLPFQTLLLGPVQPPELVSNAPLAHEMWRREVRNAWNVLQMPSEWCQAMNGVVTERNWSTCGQRRRIQEQLELAGFMCLRAVQVPLPFHEPDFAGAAVDDVSDDEEMEVEATATDNVPTRRSSEDHAMMLSSDEEGQCNTRLACLAADVLLAFLHQVSNAKVWVRCDGCNPAHRYQMQRLRQAVLYGYTRHKTADNKRVYQINTPCSVTGTTRHGGSRSSASPARRGASTGSTVHTEAVSALMTMLYFSSWHPRMLLSSEWFGEHVVCFECPSAPLLYACMSPHAIAPQQHPHYRPEAATAGIQEEGKADRGGGGVATLDTSAMVSSLLIGDEDEGGVQPTHTSHEDPHRHPLHPPPPLNVSGQSSLARLPDMEENENDVSAAFSPATYSIGEWGEELVGEGYRTPGNASVAAAAAHGPNAPSASDTASSSEQSEAANAKRADALQHRYLYVMPDDLAPLSAARWAGGYPPFVSVLTFLIEVMRRRALPLFDCSFFKQYPLLNYLYFKAVEEPTRDVFAPFEGQLQLPLQPLSHQLSSGVYEVFERDARKYRQYREAVYSYVKDWYEAGPERQHGYQNKKFFEKYGVMCEVPVPSSDERVLHLVLLGCGRGPLIDECLSAASSLGVRLRIFAMEKNRPAAAFTHMRWANDPEWAQLAYTFGHTLEVLVVDGRHVARAAQEGAVVLPPDFGLCDVIVSELLGSFGDNELSPECLDDFHVQLLTIQQSRGLHRNAHLTCIPQQYTAWVAPLMSASLEVAVAEAAVKGLTVAPPHCTDPHAALDHSLLVTNLSRGVTLAAPQPCWSFTHDFSKHRKAPRAARDSACAFLSPTTDKDNAASLMERSAHLTFTVPPCGRCSGLAGYFSCILYQSPASPAVTISTAPVQRTEDMYSWFPCTFTLDPTQRRELHEVEAASSTKCGAVTIHVDVARKMSKERQQVWYEWRVRYSDAAEAPCAVESPTVVLHNRDGWASAMFL